MNTMASQAETALDPQIAQAVQDSFARQNAMSLIQATMPVLESGMVEIHMPHWEVVCSNSMVLSMAEWWG